MLNVQTAPEAIASPPRAKRRYGDEFLNTAFGRLYEAGFNQRQAIRAYLAAADAERDRYGKLVDHLWPLLEYVQKTRPRGSESHQRHSHKLLQELLDRVWSHHMADVVANDENRPESSRFKLAERIRHCGTWMGFKECPDGHRQADATHCGYHKLCRRCARIRARKIARQYDLALQKMLDRPAAGHRLRFITLTKKVSGDPISDAQDVIDATGKWWKALYKGKTKRAAGARFIEWGSDSNAHCHFLGYLPFIKGGKTSTNPLRDKWHEITGDSYIVDIKPLGEVINGKYTVSKQDLRYIATEVVKYVTDFDKQVENFASSKQPKEIRKNAIRLGCEVVNNLARATHNMKMVMSYGSFRSDVFERSMGFKMPKPPLDETKHRCGCCGKLWASYIEVFEPRGPPMLRVVTAA